MQNYFQKCLPLDATFKISLNKSLTYPAAHCGRSLRIECFPELLINYVDVSTSLSSVIYIYIHIFINIYICTSVNPCMSMHGAGWIRVE